MIREPKKWMLIGALVLLTPVLAVAQSGSRHKGGGGGCGGDGWNRDRYKPCQQVPDGGSSDAYLIAAGATCFGAMFVRFRKSRLSH